MGGGVQSKPPTEAPKQNADKQGGFQRDMKKPGGAPSTSFQKDGITFNKGRPQFKKSEHVGNKGDFPELGLKEEDKKPEPKASVGGPIGQVSAPAKGARTQNKFEGLQEDPKAVKEE